MEEMIFFSADNLCFSYLKKPLCLKDINFKINKGDRTLILASKDMGKTTILSCLSGYEDSYFGKIKLMGREIRDVLDYDKNFSFLPATPVFFENKSILENFNYLKKVQNLPLYNENELKNLLLTYDLDIDINKKIKKTDIFIKRLLAVIRSLQKKPCIMFLDDQFVGLEGENFDEMLKIYQKVFDEFDGNLIFTIGDEIYKKCKHVLKTLKINDVFYLFDAKIEKFKDLNEFENKIINVNQELFFENRYFISSNLLKENDEFFFENDIVKYPINKSYYKFFDKLKLENYDAEEIFIVFSEKVENPFGKLLQEDYDLLKRNFHIYLKLGGELIF